MSKYSIPIEIRNSWAWNPGARPQDYESSDEPSDIDYDTEATDEWGDGSSSVSSHQQRGKASAESGSTSQFPVAGHDDDGWSTVKSKPKQQAGKPAGHPSNSTPAPAQKSKPDSYSVALKSKSGPSVIASRPNLSPHLAGQPDKPSSYLPPPEPHPLPTSAKGTRSAQSQRPLRIPGPSRTVPHATSSQRQLPKTSLVRLNPRLFNPSPDNSAKAAFRKKEPENERFELHKDAFEVAPLEVMCNTFEEMGVRCRSFIRPPQHPKDRTILIWGDPRQVSKTIAALKEWLKHLEEAPSSKSKAKKYFAKDVSTATSRYKSDQIRFAREAATKAYQQVPDPNQIFQFTLVYLWPTDEINPHEAFGHSLEAFDPVRFEHKCHIIFDDGMGAFRVFGQERLAVEAVQKRIEEALKAIIAQSGRKILLYLVDPPAASTIRAEVKLLQGPPETDGKHNTIKPQLHGCLLDAESRSKWARQSIELQKANNSKMEQVLIKAIPNLPFYRGELRIRVVFGTFHLQFLRRPENKDSIPTEDFLNSIELSRTKGKLSPDLGICNDATAVMAKLHNATNLLMPGENKIEKLEDIIPVVSGRFVVNRVDKPSVQLEVAIDNTTTDGHFYEISRSQWTRGDQKDTQLPMDVFMIQLQGGPSWELKVSVEHSLDSSKIDPRMIAFADSIRLKNRDMSKIYLKGERLFKSSPGVLKPSGFEQEISFHYRILGAPQWILEIAKYDLFDSQSPVAVKSSWGAKMWNADWNAAVAGNTGLQIGQHASWDAGLRTFFPNDDNRKIQGVDAGVVEFSQTAKRVSEFLHDLKATIGS